MRFKTRREYFHVGSVATIPVADGLKSHYQRHKSVGKGVQLRF